MPLKICANCGLKVIADARAPDPYYCQKCITKLGIRQPMTMTATPRQPVSVEPPPPEQPPVLQSVEPEPPKISNTVKITCPYCTAVFASKRLEVTARGRCPICKHEVLLFPDGSIKKPEDVIPKAPPPPPPPPPPPVVPVPELAPVEPVDSALTPESFSLPPVETPPELIAVDAPPSAGPPAVVESVSDESAPPTLEAIPDLAPVESIESVPAEPPAEEVKDEEPKRETKSFKKTTGRFSAVGKKDEKKSSRFAGVEKKTGRFASVKKENGGDATSVLRDRKPSKVALVFFIVPFAVGLLAHGVKAMSLDGDMLTSLGTIASDGINKIPSQIAGFMAEARKPKPKPRKKIIYENGPTPVADNGRKDPTPDINVVEPPPPPPTKEERIRSIDYFLSERVNKFNRKVRDLHSLERGADERRLAQIAEEKKLMEPERQELEQKDEEYRTLTGRRWTESNNMTIQK